MSSAFPAGQASHLTELERREIQRLKLIDGHSMSEIARITSRNRETVARVLAATDTQELAAQLETEAREGALRVLRAHTEHAARAWRKAIDVAADRGFHKPAMDLLLHTNVIAPVHGNQVAVGVQVIVGSPEHPAGPDPFDAVTITSRSDK